MKHPAYEKLPKERQWSDPDLQGLKIHLLWEGGVDNLATEELIKQDKGWAWRMLPNGTVVACRKRVDLWGRFELRISSMDTPEGLAGLTKWSNQVSRIMVEGFRLRILDGETPCEHAGVDYYLPPPDPRDEGKTAVRFLELRVAEVKPGQAICHRCLTGAYGEQVESETGQAVARVVGEIKEIPWWHGGGIDKQVCGDCKRLDSIRTAKEAK